MSSQVKWIILASLLSISLSYSKELDKAKKDSNNHWKPFPWAQRHRKNSLRPAAMADKMTVENTLKDMNVMTELASDIIGDLRGILSDIRNEENILRHEQIMLEEVIETALSNSDIDPADPDRLLRLS